MPETDYRFHVPFASQKVDFENAVVRGVSVMTGDLEAEGHDLQVDDTTIDQIYLACKKGRQVTVKMDHKGKDGKTFTTIAGYLNNFRKDGTKVRADLELLRTEPLTPKILEMADRMPGNFGLSAAFKGATERRFQRR
jgi:hypothetical protein